MKMYDPRNSRFRGLLRLLLAVVFGFSITSAFASFTAPIVIKYRANSTPSPDFATPQEAAVWACAYWGMSGPSVSGASGSYLARCANAGWNAYSRGIDQVATASCPSGSTVSGSSCTCDAGTVQQGSSCVSPCASKSGQPAGWYSAPYDASEGVSGAKYTNLCPTEGGYSCAIKVVYSVGFDGAKSGDATYTGSTCVADPNSDGSGTTGPSPSTSNPPEPGQPAPSPCKPGQYSGTVNGVQRCIGPSGHTPVETTKTTVDDNGTDTVKTESSTVCNAGACNTTTTTTTTNNSSSSSSVTTGTKSEPKGDYCSANPNSSQCSTECQGNTGTVACAKFGNPVDGQLPTNEVNIPTVQTDNLAGFNIGHSCPADLTYTISGKQYALSFKAACDVAPMVKPVVLLGAALGALFIVYAALVGKTS